jgi:hypothetical protein
MLFIGNPKGRSIMISRDDKSNYMIKNALDEMDNSNDMCAPWTRGVVTDMLAKQIACLSWNTNHALCKLAILLGRLDASEANFKVDWTYVPLKVRLQDTTAMMWSQPTHCLERVFSSVKIDDWKSIGILTSVPRPRWSSHALSRNSVSSMLPSLDAVHNVDMLDVDIEHSLQHRVTLIRP